MDEQRRKIVVNISVTGLIVLVLFLYGLFTLDLDYSNAPIIFIGTLFIDVVSLLLAIHLADIDKSGLALITIMIFSFSSIVTVVSIGYIISKTIFNLILSIL